MDTGTISKPEVPKSRSNFFGQFNVKDALWKLTTRVESMAEFVTDKHSQTAEIHRSETTYNILLMFTLHTHTTFSEMATTMFS